MNRVEMLVNLLQEKGSVCLTGEIPECDRMEICNVFEAIGLRVVASPSKMLSFLLTAEGAKQKKIDMAKYLGIPIFTTEEFWEALNCIYSEVNSV